jgi:ferric-dicitrate binding protein FerR (iron transport regulator)
MVARKTALILLFLSSAALLFGQRFEFVDGAVTVRLAAGGQRDGLLGDPLANGDVVVTGSDGFAIISMAGGASVKLREDTELQIASLGETPAVNLTRGSVFAQVRRVASTVAGTAFEVRTPTVTAGVRGTEFFVAYGRTIEDEPDLWLCVNEGSVEVSVPTTGESVLVPAGQGINILAGLRVTDPRPYSWTRDLNWNFDPASGEVYDDTDLDQAYSDLLDQDYD